MSENTPVGFEVISVITAELSAKVSRGQATPSASHSAASSRKMYLHAIREGIRRNQNAIREAIRRNQNAIREVVRRNQTHSLK